MSFDRKYPGASLACLTLLLLMTLCVTGAYSQKEMKLTGTKAAVAQFVAARDKAERQEDVGTLYDQVIVTDPTFAYAYLFAGRTNAEIRKNRETAVRLADTASPGEREWIYAARDGANGDIAGRLSHLKQLVTLFPKDKRAHVLLANYYRARGDDATALAYLNNAIKIDKKYAPAYNLIGYTNMALHRNDAAEKAFKTYIKLHANNANPYDSYGEFLMSTGRYDDSIVQYNLALSKDASFYPSYRGIGNNYSYKGDHAKARETFQTMYAKSTNDAGRDEALVAEMNSWVTEGRIEKALELNDRRIATAQKVGDIGNVIGLHQLSAFVALMTGDIPTTAIHAAMADKHADDASLLAATKGYRQFSNDMQLAEIAASKGDFAAAKTSLDAMHRFAASTGGPAYQQAADSTSGWVELKQKNYARANEFFAKVTIDNPMNWYYSGLAYEGLGDTKTAMALYRKVADWNQQYHVGYAIVRPLALAKLKN